MKALLVVNPRAGGHRGPAEGAEIRRQLRAAGMEVCEVGGEGPGETLAGLRAALQQESPERARVVVAGGDGTINAILPAVMETEFSMAILPVGSVNVFARELGIPLSVAEAAAVAAGGRPRVVDLGVANGRPFALMAGMGFDAAVVHSVAPEMKKVVGAFAYVARGLGVLANCRLSRFRITTEREELQAEAWLAVVANTSRYTYGWRLAPEARVCDGWLDLCLFCSESAPRTAGQVVAALTGRHTGYPGVRHVRARQMRFECEPAVCVQVDGDAAGETPAEVHVAPGSLRVVAPGEG